MSIFLLVLSLVHINSALAHEGEESDLVSAAETVASLSQREPVALEAKRKSGGVDISVLFLAQSLVKAENFDCLTRENEALSCNGQEKRESNPKFAELVQAAESLGEGLKEAGGNPESIFYFKTYKRANGKVWARVQFLKNAIVTNAVFSCHVHGEHYDCHFQNQNSRGPDEPLAQ